MKWSFPAEELNQDLTYHFLRFWMICETMFWEFLQHRARIRYISKQPTKYNIKILTINEELVYID